MATIRAYTDLEQSRKLAEILPLESADMWYSIVDNEAFICLEHNNEYEQIPCWSLAALLSILPQIQGGKPVIALDDNYITYPHTSVLYTKADNLVNACYKLILRLYELKML